jgi:lipopolysaccharide transport system permease protein
MSTELPPIAGQVGGERRIVELRPGIGMFDLQLGEVWRYRGLLYYLIWRELKVRYKQAALGGAWAIVQPLFAVAIFTVIFGRFARFPSDGIPYSLFAFAGVLPWMYFSESVRRSSVGPVSDSELVRKIFFPRLLIPVAMVIAPLVDFAVAFVVFLIMLAWHGIWPGINMLALIPMLLFTGCMALAMGLWLGPINVRFRDIMHTLPFMLQVWMYASPIIYPLSIIPEQWRPLYSLNPMVGIIEGFRWALLGKQSPDFGAMGVSAAVVVVLLISGLIFFKKSERSFADVI